MGRVDRAALDTVLTDEVTRWPGPAGVAVVDHDGVLGAAGDLDSAWAWASVTKVVTALTILQVARAGAVSLDDEAGPPGSTLRHLLAHASGIAFDSDRVLAAPGVRRIYSNRGIELAAEHVQQCTGRVFPDLVRDVLLDPLGMARTRLEEGPATGATGPVADLVRLVQDLLAPRVLPGELVGEASRTAFPDLSGVLPGFGRQEPNDWGLGVEVRGSKRPHWTPPSVAPETFGHFGQSGSFLWVDPVRGLACVAAGEVPFGPWAAEAWPRLGTRILNHLAVPGGPEQGA